MGAGKPWREAQVQLQVPKTRETKDRVENNKLWTEEYLEELKKCIGNISCKAGEREIKGNIALIGPIGSGKSSFINSVLSVNEGEIVQAAPEGRATYSFTKKFKRFYCGNFLVSDTMGLELEGGINAKDIEYLAKGHVPIGYQFDPEKPIEQSKDFVKEPKFEDGVHCFVFVVDSTNAFDGSFKEKTKYIKPLYEKLASIGEIPSAVILTKIDELDEAVKKDVGKTFHSRRVRDAVIRVEEMLGIPQKFIFPVKNFTDEQSPHTKESILIMLALLKLIRFTKHFVTYKH